MDESKRTEIFYTIVNNDYGRYLEEFKSLKDINIVDINGMSLLHFCGEYSRSKFAEHLIQNNIDIELKDSYGNNALWKAVFNSRGNYELVGLLLENNANSKSKNNASKSPFELALTMGDKRLIGLLSEPEFKCYADWKQLAILFNYEIDEYEQDWTYNIAESERIDEYLETYDKLKNIEAKFSLFEMIIQSVNDQTDKKFNIYWDKLKPILDLDFDLNKSTIYYWCVWIDDDLENCFKITGRMREYWLSKTM